MGTSNPYGGPKGGTPLVPSWLDLPGDSSANNGVETGLPSDGETSNSLNPETGQTQVPPAIPSVAVSARFATARNNFSRFVRSGGSDRKRLGHAISNYVSTAAGGSRQAARRMGASRAAGAGLIGFLNDARSHGVQNALRTLNLDALAGRPIEEVFLGLADYVCPEGSTVDDGIARSAFIEMIVELSQVGIESLDSLTVDQMNTVFEIFATNAIEARICNDIGMKAISLPANVAEAQYIEDQLHDFIQRGVSDALTRARHALETLTESRVLEFVDKVYESAFALLQALGESED